MIPLLVLYFRYAETTRKSVVINPTSEVLDADFAAFKAI